MTMDCEEKFRKFSVHISLSALLEAVVDDGLVAD